MGGQEIGPARGRDQPEEVPRRLRNKLDGTLGITTCCPRARCARMPNEADEQVEAFRAGRDASRGYTQHLRELHTSSLNREAQPDSPAGLP